MPYYQKVTMEGIRQHILTKEGGNLFYFIYSFFNVDNYRKNTVYNKNSSKMLIDVNTLVKKRKQNY